MLGQEKKTWLKKINQVFFSWLRHYMFVTIILHDFVEMYSFVDHLYDWNQSNPMQTCCYVPAPGQYWSNAGSIGPVLARCGHIMACLQGL